VLLWLALGAGLVMQVWNATQGANRTIECIKVGFIVFGGLGVVLPAYLNFWQSAETAALADQRLAWDKEVFEFRKRWDLRENALKLVDEWDAERLAKARKSIRKLRDERNALSSDQLVEKVNANDDLRDDLIRIFNFWDGVRASVESERVDETIVYQSLHPALFSCFEACSAWLRKEGEKNKNFFEDVERLHNRWKSPNFAVA
jgi:hypothetical protein